MNWMWFCGQPQEAWPKTTPFSLAYRVKAMAPAKVNVTPQAKIPRNIKVNKEMMLDFLDEIKERCHQALLQIKNYQHQIESYFNKRTS